MTRFTDSQILEGQERLLSYARKVLRDHLAKMGPARIRRYNDLVDSFDVTLQAVYDMQRDIHRDKEARKRRRTETQRQAADKGRAMLAALEREAMA